MPILLYGSEVWGPYMDFDYISWDKCKIERAHTQYLKRLLGCNVSTSNNMARGELGVRPLLIQVIQRVIFYISNIKGRNHSVVNNAFQCEQNEEISISNFVGKFNLDINDLCGKSKYIVKKVCQSNYDRYWLTALNGSPKALSYILFKGNVCLEKYLYQVKNKNHRKALSRFRLSNHPLLIEKGRHLKPPLERNDRKCFICKNEVENEIHFLITCPLYRDERESLFHTCRENCRLFDSIPSEEQKYIFIMTNENINVIKAVAKFIINSLKLRENVRET